MTPIPAPYEAIRARIEDILGTPAVLAGGAVRDTLLGRPVKDLDIYVNGDFTALKTVEQAELNEYLGGSFMNVEDEYGFQDGVNSVYTGARSLSDDLFDFIQVQVVFMAPRHPVLAIHETFSTGLSRVSWDGKEYQLSHAFINDRDNKRVTQVVRGDNKRQRENFRRHAQRIAEKYQWPAHLLYPDRAAYEIVAPAEDVPF